MINDLYREVLVKFVELKVICDSSSLKIEYQNKINHKCADEILIGSETKRFIDAHLTTSGRQPFIEAAVEYYSKILAYMKAKMPIEDELLIHAKVLDIGIKTQTTLSSLIYFTKWFPSICAADKEDQLEEEFARYQIIDLPSSLSDMPVDQQWAQIAQMKNSHGDLMFGLLGRVMMIAIMVIPHNNVDCERIFSLVSKNMTKFRSSMSPETLEALLILKSSSDVYGKANEVKVSRNILVKCQKVTKSSLTS